MILHEKYYYCHPESAEGSVTGSISDISYRMSDEVTHHLSQIDQPADNKKVDYQQPTKTTIIK